MRVRTTPTACALLVAATLASTGPASPAHAEAPPGWVVDKVRFESIADDGGSVTVEGQGAYRPTGSACMAARWKCCWIRGILKDMIR